MKAKFWGTRGGIASPSLGTIELGGNTSCVQIILNEHHSLILDSGTGIIEYATSGIDLKKENEFHILITHFHWDHIIGFPFFHAIHSPKAVVNLYSPFPSHVLLEHMSSLFDGTYSPLKDISNVNALISFYQIPPEGININGAWVDYCQTTHPEECYAYKIKYKKKVLTYVTDHEINDTGNNEEIIKFIEHSDLLIHDAQYSKEEYSLQFKGWGHSTIDGAIQNAEKAKVKKMLLFHHSADHSDDFLRVYLDRFKKRNKYPLDHSPVIDFSCEQVTYEV